MPENEIRAYAQEKGFHQRTLARWLGWEQGDRDALGDLALRLRMSENHLRDMMDWLEEIALRDHTTIHRILSTKAVHDKTTDPRLGRADKVKQIKEQLRRLRFPRLVETEDEIRNKIQELNLHPEIRLSVPPGLEGGRLCIEFCAASAPELRALTTRLCEAAGTSLAPEIFDLLAGHCPENKHESDSI
jgi:hypothetical protein